MQDYNFNPQSNITFLQLAAFVACLIFKVNYLKFVPNKLLKF